MSNPKSKKLNSAIEEPAKMVGLTPFLTAEKKIVRAELSTVIPPPTYRAVLLTRAEEIKDVKVEALVVSMNFEGGGILIKTGEGSTYWVPNDKIKLLQLE